MGHMEALGFGGSRQSDRQPSRLTSPIKKQDPKYEKKRQEIHIFPSRGIREAKRIKVKSGNQANVALCLLNV